MTEKTQRTKTERKARDTGMAMVLICLLALLAGGEKFWLLMSIFLLVATMTWPKLFKPLVGVWFGLTHLLGSAVSFVILTLIFYVVVTPVAFIRRLKGADTLQLKQWRRTTTSVFVEKEHTYVPSDLEHPY